jgi:hypothetical protein
MFSKTRLDLLPALANQAIERMPVRVYEVTNSR